MDTRFRGCQSSPITVIKRRRAEIYDAVFGDKLKWSESFASDRRVLDAEKILNDLNLKLPAGCLKITVNNTYEALERISGYANLTCAPTQKQSNPDVQILSNSQLDDAKLKINDLFAGSGLKVTLRFLAKTEGLSFEIENPLMSDADWQTMWNIDEVLEKAGISD